MKRNEQVRDLGRRFAIETPHMEQVARHALDLFDGFGFDRAARPLLKAAALLHDIGYASDPDNHVDEGLRILQENPLPAFSSRDWKTVCLIVSLHRRDWRPVLTDDVMADLGKKRVDLAMQLAAALRIADGLDHSHIQDASILSCRRGKKTDKIDVCSRWYAGNIPWAEGKADLWEAVFTRTVCIRPVAAPPHAGIVREDDDAVSAARRILYSHYARMRDEVPGILNSGDSDALHRYSRALNSFRETLEAFRPLLRNTSAKKIEKALAKLSERLDAPCGAVARFGGFQSLENAGADHPALFQTLETGAQAALRSAAEVIASDACLKTVGRMNRFLRVELPALERQAGAEQ